MGAAFETSVKVNGTDGPENGFYVFDESK